MEPPVTRECAPGRPTTTHTRSAITVWAPWHRWYERVPHREQNVCRAPPDASTLKLRPRREHHGLARHRPNAMQAVSGPAPPPSKTQPTGISATSIPSALRARRGFAIFPTPRRIRQAGTRTKRS